MCRLVGADYKSIGATTAGEQVRGHSLVTPYLQDRIAVPHCTGNGTAVFIYVFCHNQLASARCSVFFCGAAAREVTRQAPRLRTASLQQSRAPAGHHNTSGCQDANSQHYSS
jgi:hypothetical protein